MATLAEIEAAIAKADKAGRTDLADQLRAYAAKMQSERVNAAIAKAEAAGRQDLADQLRAASQPKPAAPDLAVIEGPVEGRILSPEEQRQSDLSNFAQFEAANPPLAGQYTPETMPRAGDLVVMGGGGRGGGGRYTVQPWTANDIRQQGSFGETAASMMEGPVAAARAFGGGLTGGPSPSREFLAQDPLTRGLPSPVLTGLGAIGDIGGAALSTVGAGLSGAVGLATEAVPFQDAAGREKLGNELLGMSMFAVPELAGASSIPARVAGAAPAIAPVARAVPKLADDVAAAQRAGIPVLRTDVKPPTTFFGEVARKTGESIPLAGTGAARAKQNAARIEAAQNFAREYGAESAAPAIDDVTASLLEKRATDLTKYTKQKRDVIDGLSGKGVVPVPKAVAAIDDQIAKLRKQNMAGLDPVIAKLEEFKTAIKDQGLTEIEANRAVIGEAFSGADMGAIRGVGEKALSAIYGPLRADMADFIKAVGGQEALNKWGSANARLSEMAGELKNNTLKRALTAGEATPETVRNMLFSAKPSDVKRLSENLNEKGRASARTAIMQEVLAKSGGVDDLSPEKFKAALGKLGSQVGVFFKGDDFAAADGLLRALKLTERAGKAGVAPLTGVQNLPAVVGILVNSFFGGSIPATAAALGTIGGIARVYEATGVKAALRALSKADTPKAQGTAIQSLEKALESAGVPVGQAAAGQAANSNAGPDYEALWGRY